VIRWEQQENGDWHGFSGELRSQPPAPDASAPPLIVRREHTVCFLVEGLTR
jgi:hypothetical protein